MAGAPTGEPRGGRSGGGGGRTAPATTRWPMTEDQRTLPYETLFVQIFSRRTTVFDLGACQIRPLPA